MLWVRSERGKLIMTAPAVFLLSNDRVHHLSGTTGFLNIGNSSCAPKYCVNVEPDRGILGCTVYRAI